MRTVGMTSFTIRLLLMNNSNCTNTTSIALCSVQYIKHMRGSHHNICEAVISHHITSY